MNAHMRFLTDVTRLRASIASIAILLASGTRAIAQAPDMDVPFVTTPLAVSEAMLTIAAVGKQDYVIDLGSGDGRIVILAAKKFGARGLGVEIDPRLVELSRVEAKRAGVADRAEFRDQDFFATDLSPASVVTMYLLPDVNLALRPKLLALKPGTRVVSHDWDMGDWRPDTELRVPAPEKKLGLDRTSRVMLWTVPARVEGRWCSDDPAGSSLTLRQRYQQVEGEAAGAVAIKISGKLDGARMRVNAGGEAELRAGRLVFAGAAPLSGAWARSEGPCPAR